MSCRVEAQVGHVGHRGKDHGWLDGWIIRVGYINNLCCPTFHTVMSSLLLGHMTGQITGQKGSLYHSVSCSSCSRVPGEGVIPFVKMCFAKVQVLKAVFRGGA